MNQSDDERELALVTRYLEEHYNPIRGLVNRKVVDPEARELALRRCTKHIFHWKREVLGDEVGPDHPDYGEPATPRQLAVLKDRGIGVPEACTKARASQLISRHVYGGVEA